MPSIEPTMRRLTTADAAGCVALASRVQWSQSVSTWEQCIRWGAETSLCLAVGDQIVTTALALRYSERLAWVGMVITDPDYQGRGLARRLMNVVMERLADYRIQSVMLDASEKGFPLYQKLGFRTLYPMEVWAGSAAPTTSPSSAQPLQEGDIEDIITLDAEWMGIERPNIIRGMWQPGLAWIDRENGVVSGYLLAQSDARGVHIGPWYHRSPHGAQNLMSAAVNTFAGQAVRMQIPQANPAACALLPHFGLKLSRLATRMVYGAEPPGNMPAQYSIAGFPTG